MTNSVDDLITEITRDVAKQLAPTIVRNLFIAETQSMAFSNDVMLTTKSMDHECTCEFSLGTREIGVDLRVWFQKKNLTEVPESVLCAIADLVDAIREAAGDE